jgi:hypothetical protein
MSAKPRRDGVRRAVAAPSSSTITQAPVTCGPSTMSPSTFGDAEVAEANSTAVTRHVTGSCAGADLRVVSVARPGRSPHVAVEEREQRVLELDVVPALRRR